MPVAHDGRDGCSIQGSAKSEQVLFGNARHQNNAPSVPSDNVVSFCSKASIWFATAALRSRSSFRFCSSAFFSSMRAIRAGDCDEEDAEPVARICEDNDLVA